MDTNEKNFLNMTNKIIRKCIKDIDDSYSHFWDILAELIQNSVDAINKYNQYSDSKRKGIIAITINCINKNITIYDNGIGFQKDKIPELLTPFSTDKELEFESKGEKGVGIDFAIFQSNHFTIKSKYYTDNSISYKEITDAKNWKNSNSDYLPKLKNIPINEDTNFNGTEITLEDIENDELFSLNFTQLKYVLRTKTAIGNVLALFEETDDIDVYLKVTDINGIYKEEKIPYKYWIPTENCKSNMLLDLDEFDIWLEGNHNDESKKQKIKNKILLKKGDFDHNGRKIKYWSCFVPSRDVWEHLSCNDSLLDSNKMNLIKSNEEKSDYLDSQRALIHSAGIYSSTKGMPTGIETNHSLYSGNAGYLPHFFIIFEDASLKFDIGRKSLHAAIRKIYEKHAKIVFNKFTATVLKYKDISDDDDDISSVWDIVKASKDIDLIPNINYETINFQKSPSEQEASVIAIFYELIGRDILLPDTKKLFKNFELVTTKYKEKYDLIAKLNSNIITIEFKSKLNKIISDLNNNIKRLNELNYIVCWNVDDADRIDFK